MPDMLVKLYTLPDLMSSLAAQQSAGVEVRRAIAPEKHVVVEWVRQMFGQGWANECEVALGQVPASCFVAIEHERPVGFACYDATCKNFFGPVGVDPDCRGRKIGEALLLACLHSMAGQGYAYAIIGGVGPADFYAKTVGAVLIEDSVPGVYRGLLRSTPDSTEA